MLYGAKESTLEINGAEACRVKYISFGKGEKPLVIIPGLSLRSIKGMAFPLAYMYRVFAKDFKVFVFDRRDEVHEGFTVSGIADDTAEAMRTLGIKSADVIGISQGGMAAQYLAVRYPELVRTLILGVTLSRMNETVTAAVNGWVKSAGSGDIGAVVNDMIPKMYSDSYMKKYKRLLPVISKFTKLEDHERFVILAKACLTCDIYGELDKIKCPVLVIGGKLDKIVTGEASEDIAEKLISSGCKCKLLLYDELGHAAYEEAEDFNRKILDFILDSNPE